MVGRRCSTRCWCRSRSPTPRKPANGPSSRCWTCVRLITLCAACRCPPDFVFFSRLNLSMNAVLSALGATVYARAMLDDMDGIAPPVTELGRRHDAWVRQRGLPHGMDDYAVN